MTIILAFLHAMSSNKDFQPDMLYLGTFMIDMQLATVIFSC